MENTTSNRNTKVQAIVFTVVVLLTFTIVLIVPATKELFILYADTHYYIMGFIKFALLSTVGDILAIKLKTKLWSLPEGFIAKAFVWGLIGMAVPLVFQIFLGGVTNAMTKGYLPSSSQPIVFAFFVSSTMNLTFGIALMCFHRITDAIIDLKVSGNKKIDLAIAAQNIDWVKFVTFVICKTIPLFWIPAHTISFLLPEEYRVMFAATLSIVMGFILNVIPKKKEQA